MLVGTLIPGPWPTKLSETDSCVWLTASWAAIEPQLGVFDEAVLDRMDQAVTHARRKKIEPIICLHHGTLPDWQVARGGWLDPDIGATWGCYVDRLARQIAEKITFWFPFRSITHEAAWYPGHERKAALGMIHAHASAYLILHRGPGFGGRPARVGCMEPLGAAKTGHFSVRGAALSWSARKLVASLATGKLKLPFSPMGELSNGTPALDVVGVEGDDIEGIDQAALWKLPIFALGLPPSQWGEAQARAQVGARLEGVLREPLPHPA